MAIGEFESKRCEKIVQKYLEDFLAVVDKDEYGCFYG